MDLKFDQVGDALFNDSDDWSFLVKVHALMETAVSHVLAHAGEGRLVPIFERLAKQRMAAKLDYLKAGGLLDEARIGFVRVIGEMRNDAVHDFRHLSFTFSEYLDKHPTTRDRLVDTAGQFVLVAEAQDATPGIASSNPRALVAVAALFVLFSVRVAHGRRQLEKQRAEVVQGFVEAIRREAELERKAAASSGE